MLHSYFVESRFGPSISLGIIGGTLEKDLKKNVGSHRDFMHFATLS
jgi:hypothetical protein